MSERAGGKRGSPLFLHERALILAALLATSALSWAYLTLSQEGAPGAGMAGMGMPGAAPSRLALGVDFLMWSVMMTGMMLPSASPMILTFATISRRRRARGEVFVPTAVFLCGYLLVWVGFSLAAALLDWGLAQKGVRSPFLGALLMLLAGGYQLTPLKRVCLSKCRSPFEFLLTRWHEGRIGAFKTGFEHGLFCLGCCWLLMALFFAAGAMNLLWAAAIAAFIFVEKVLPKGAWTGRASGGLMIAFGLYLLSGPLLGAR